MKTTLLTSLLLVCLFTSVGALGYEGKAYLSMYDMMSSSNVLIRQYVSTHVFLSNTSGHDTDVQVTLYNQNNVNGQPQILLDGDDNLLTGTFNASTNAVNYNESPTNTGASVEFTIKPYESVIFTINYAAAPAWSPRVTGYGVIEWSQPTETIFSLLGNAYSKITQLYSTGQYITWSVVIPINNGNPF